jgi:hypothetical protein
MKLGGIIYLHDIIQPRMTGTARRNLELFRKLCGDDAHSKVILGTTKWGEVKDETGPKLREKELRGEYWKVMIDGGSVVRRFEGTMESAWELVRIILDKAACAKSGKFTDALQIQKELIDYQRLIPETKAGKQLRSTLERQLLELQQTMNSVGAQLDDPQAQAMLRQSRDKIGGTLRQLGDLKIALPRRILEFFRLVVSPLRTLRSLFNIIISNRFDSERCSIVSAPLLDSTQFVFRADFWLR